MQAFIGRIQPCSDIWKGRNSFLIEFAGCNFNCPYCNSHYLHPTKEEYNIDLKEVKRQIKSSLSSIDTLFFSGGEPCLQRQALLNLAGFAKDHGLKVGIATNGSKPETLRSLISLDLLDLVAMDIKAPLDDNIEKVTLSGTFFITPKSILEDIERSLELLRRNQERLQIEFRTTIVPGLMFKKEHMDLIASSIEHIESRWVLQRFDPGNVANKRFSDIEPPSQGFIDNLKQYLQKKYPGLRIDI